MTIMTSGPPFLYNGQFGVQTDPNGLLYMRARYYNPYICRFLNADPSGFGGGLNFYLFCNGNPISETDPFGLQSWIGAGYGVIPPPNYGPSSPTVGGPLSGFINFVTGGGKPVTIGHLCLMLFRPFKHRKIGRLRQLRRT